MSNEPDKEIFIFDFCDTLAGFQTADAFVKYCEEHSALRRPLIIALEKAALFLHVRRFAKIVYPKMNIYKQMKLLRVRGLSEETIEALSKEYYCEQVKPRLNKQVVDELARCIQEGNEVAIVSGGYEPYIKHFAEEHGVENILATEFKYRNGIFTGGIVGRDCMDSEKVKRVRLHYGVKCLNERFSSSTCYSDSPSDLPLFRMCSNKVCVLRSCEGVPEWAEELHARIIWV